ncbi:hypothetical protein MMC07_003721 [Pseudocyphellaria aurata]|nr:hypothetical protein [Pseudocyphellaria aurata]
MEHWAKYDEQIRIKKLELAKEKGFSTYEELQEFKLRQFDERHAQYEAFLDEECKRRGITREQLYAEDPQRPPDEPECNCDGHLNPLFCPERLQSYNSIIEDPSGLIKSSHPPQIEQLHMKEDDKSKRLSEEALEQYWGMDSQKWPRELPQWVRRDPVVKQITVYEIEHPSVPPSCSTESSIFTGSQSRSPTVQTTDESDISNVASKDSMLPKLNSTSLPKAPSSKVRKSKQTQTKTADISCLSMPSGVLKRRPRVASRIHKLPSHTMQTRSQDALTFYALDSYKRTISFRKARRTTNGEKRKASVVTCPLVGRWQANGMSHADERQL